MPNWKEHTYKVNISENNFFKRSSDPAWLTNSANSGDMSISILTYLILNVGCITASHCLPSPTDFSSYDNGATSFMKSHYDLQWYLALFKYPTDILLTWSEKSDDFLLFSTRKYWLALAQKSSVDSVGKSYFITLLLNVSYVLGHVLA